MKREEATKKYINKLEELSVGWGLYDKNFKEAPEDEIGFICVENKKEVKKIFEGCEIVDENKNFICYKID